MENLPRYCTACWKAWQTIASLAKVVGAACETSSGFGFQQNWVGILVRPLTSGIVSKPEFSLPDNGDTKIHPLELP